MRPIQGWMLVFGLLVLGNARPANGQAVQLPTIQRFGVGTSVLVPDRGGVVIGGVRRSAEGSVTRGIPGGPLLRSRAIGREASASSVSVHATIIDLRALDQAVLEEAARRRALSETGVAGAGAADEGYYPASSAHAQPASPVLGRWPAWGSNR